MSDSADLIPHLHCHTEYSLAHGLLRLSGEQELGKLAAERGIGAVALTDTNNVFAAIHHQASCRRHGVKPLLGCHAKFIRDKQEFSASLLCANATGFRRLSRLLTRAQLKNHGYIDPAQLTDDDLTGLIMLTGYDSDVCNAIREGDKTTAAARLGYWRQLFGSEHFVCELTFGGRKDEKELTCQLAQLATQQHVPAVAAHPVLFATKQDYYSHEVRSCIATSWRLDDKRRPHPYSAEQYLLSATELRERFANWPQALANAAELARRCNYDFGLREQPVFPRYGKPGEDMAQRLRDNAHAGLKQVVTGNVDMQPYLDRLHNELAVIIDKGFADYFLIVADFVNYARDHDIPVGPGRGSGAGSLVAYALGITGVDPLHYGLLFERFLNTERTALPDFDIDFCKKRRSEIFAHAREVYGDDCVAQVVTFGTLKAKAVVRDVGRVLGLPYATADQIARLIPDELNITLRKARTKARELNKFLQNENRCEELWTHGLALEGLARQPSTHAAAILIAPQPLAEHYCPLALVGTREASTPVSQYDMDAAAKVGLIKFDFLGLKNLTMLHQAVNIVRATDANFSLENLRLDDRKSFDLYHQGATVGIFQCESQGMIALMRQLKPHSIDDIALTISMYRPGVLSNNMHRIYLNARDDPSQANYPHDKARPILEATCGVMIYQEQVMRLSQVLGGFSLAKADILRAAIGKKNEQLMDSLGADFIQQSAKLLGEKQAYKLFQDIKEFAGYGFNKSHAIAYALISYQTAYLKCHHPAAFYAASLSTWADDSKALTVLLEDARCHKIKVALPCVNKSGVDFTVTGEQQLCFGLGAIHGVGGRFAEELVAQRTQNGAFTSLENLVTRSPRVLLNRRVMESLVTAGACDNFAPAGVQPNDWRSRLEHAIPALLEFATFHQRHSAQNSLFKGDNDTPLPITGVNETTRPWTLKKQYLAEQQVLGLPLSGDYLGIYTWLLNAIMQQHKSKLTPLQELESHLNGDNRLWAGYVSKYITTPHMREQEREVFRINDGKDSIEVQAERKATNGIALGEPGQVVLINGKAKLSKNDRLLLHATQVYDMDSWCAQTVKAIVLPLSNAHKHWLQKQLRYLQAKRLPGKCAVRLRLQAKQITGDLEIEPHLQLKADDLVRLHTRLGDALTIFA